MPNAKVKAKDRPKRAAVVNKPAAKQSPARAGGSRPSGGKVRGRAAGGGERSSPERVGHAPAADVQGPPASGSGPVHGGADQAVAVAAQANANFLTGGVGAALAVSNQRAHDLLAMTTKWCSRCHATLTQHEVDHWKQGKHKCQFHVFMHPRSGPNKDGVVKMKTFDDPDEARAYGQQFEKGGSKAVVIYPFESDAKRAAQMAHIGENLLGREQLPPLIWPDMAKVMAKAKVPMPESTKQALAARNADRPRSIGDEIAQKLDGKSLPQVYEEGAKYLGEKLDALIAKYKHLNPGQQRMVIGNRMRAKWKNENLKPSAPARNKK